MIDRITITDDEEGTFTYDREEDNPFHWYLTGPNGRDVAVQDGRDVVWQIAQAVTEGVER